MRSYSVVEVRLMCVQDPGFEGSYIRLHTRALQVDRAYSAIRSTGACAGTPSRVYPLTNQCRLSAPFTDLAIMEAPRRRCPSFMSYFALPACRPSSGRHLACFLVLSNSQGPQLFPPRYFHLLFTFAPSTVTTACFGHPFRTATPFIPFSLPPRLPHPVQANSRLMW